MKPTLILRKPTAVFLQSGPLDVGQGKISGIIALTLGGLARPVGAGLPLSRIPHHAGSAPEVRRERAARNPAGRDGDRRRACPRQPGALAQSLAERHRPRPDRDRRRRGRPPRSGRRLSRQHALYRARLVRARPAGLKPGVHPDREAVSAASWTAGFPAGLAGRLHAFRGEPPSRRPGAGDRQLRHPPPVRLAGLGAAPEVGRRAAVLRRATRACRSWAFSTCWASRKRS